MITKRELITIGFSNVKITEPIDWEQYIQLIKTSTNSHYPMFDLDLSNPYSLFGQLQDTIDLDLNNPDWDVITEEVGNNPWNESIGNLINYYIDNFVWEENETPEIVRTWTEDGEAHITRTSFDDLLKANAGNYFIEEWTPVDDIADVPEDENWTRWTIKTEQLRDPDFWVWHPMNIDEEHYQQVRGDDRSKLALQSGRNLQFAHSQDLYPKEESSAVGERNRRLEKYLRLIMPKYTRRVEIEDLNRDFWVIGEAISEISGFLFDDESPLAKMFKGITSELTQIWENLIYLWSGYILSQSKECPIKVIYMPLPNNSAQTQRKYDYFEESLDNKESTWKKCEYLIDKYPNNSLVIIPYVRSGNYKHNYFDTYSIAYILTYNRLKNIRDTISVQGKDSSFFWLQIRQTCQNGMNFQNWVYGVQKTENEQYKVIGNVFNAVEDTPSKYYAAARVDFKGVEAEYHGNGNIVLSNFQLDVVDPYKDKIIVNITGDQEGNTMTLIGVAAQGSEQSSGSYTIDNYSGYLGEMISTTVLTRQTPIVHTGDFQVVKIGDFYPEDIDFNSLIRITQTQGASDTPFCTDTYGIGAYYHTPVASYSEETRVHFIRYDNGGIVSSSNLTKQVLEKIGQNYLEKLYNENSINSGLCVTKIGIGYWSGDSGSAWSYGLFSDLFYVDNNGKAKKLKDINIFDGYWCSSSTPEGDIPYFTTVNYSRWRQPIFTCESIIYSDDGTYSLKNGSFQWNDYNSIVYPNETTYNTNRPNAKMSISNGELVFNNYQNNDNKEMLPKVSFYNINQIVNPNKTKVNEGCFYISSPTSLSTDIYWSGSKDAANFIF